MTPVTVERAQEVFDALAAKGDEIAFRWLREGCECRAQLMIEQLQAMGIEPARVWAVSVGRLLRGVSPDDPSDRHDWLNRVAPTLAVAGRSSGSPSLTLPWPAPVRWLCGSGPPPCG